MRFETLSRRIAPVVSLAGGAVTLFLLRRGIDFAPIAAALAVFAWLFAALLSGYLSEPSAQDGAAIPKWHGAMRWFSRTFVVGLFQNVLFFVLPVWFGSAELFSANIAFPLVLATLALFSCFDDHFARWVLRHRARRALAGALLLFSVSVPAVAYLVHVPLRLGVALTAAAATFAAVVFGWRWRGAFRTLPVGLFLAILFGTMFYFAAFLLPPVPVQCVSKLASARMENRQPVGIAEVFPAGTKKIYVHFSVAAPDRFQQDIRFQWYVDGKARGRPIPSSIVGGRKRGFRTRTFLSNPPRGRYRVDLETGEGQLIGRVGFRVK